MGRKMTVEKTRVYIECSDMPRKVKGHVISRDENTMKVELPSGFVMELAKRNNGSLYKLQVGMLEFISDGKLVV